MNKLASFIALFAAAPALAGTTISDVVIRQQWPWKADVKVDFVVSGTAGGITQVTMAAYRGDTFLGNIPQSACSGSLIVTSDGAKSLTFDPTAIDFLASQGVMGNFRLDVTAADATDDEILYKIFDLTKTAGTPGAVQYVTEHALTNGLWGAWERDYWGEDMARTVIWTGVTNDAAYKTTHLVMRRIPAGSFTYGTSTDCDLYVASDTPAMTVTISKPYYMAVFETTISQYCHILDPGTNNVSMYPSNYKYYLSTSKVNAIRGNSNGSSSYEWPTGRSVWSTSIVGRLRTRTGVNFDLPTEAQWEKAARAGSAGIYYDSNSEVPDATRLSKLAWNYSNSKNGGDSRSSQRVGQLKPNAYGLYDVLGNVAEIVLDWQEAAYVPDPAIDPEGPTSGSNRVTKGLNYETYATSASGSASVYVHIGNRAGVGQTAGNARWGYRFCCPAE